MPQSRTELRIPRRIIGARDGSPTLFLASVFALALIIRLSAMVLKRSYHITDFGDDLFSFGWEMGRVGRSLALGQGFSSPMPAPTGPTAIVGPVYPMFLAVVFKLFGVYTTASALIILSLQCVFSSLGCVFIYLCGRDTTGEAAGKLAALVWAVFPLNIYFTLTRIWETSITATLTALLFWWLLSLPNSTSPARWAKTGVLLAFVAMTNTSLVVLSIPFFLAALWTSRSRAIIPAISAALTFTALVSPWLIRNYQVFHKVMMRSNFPLEFRVGNNELSRGQKIESLHPATSPDLNQHWHDIGETRFMAEESALNSRYIATHPGSFAFATGNRIVYYWSGAWLAPTNDYPNTLGPIVGTTLLSLAGFLGIGRLYRSNKPVALLYTGCLFLYPMLYYVTTSQPRFYHALTPLLISAGAGWVVNWKGRAGTRDLGPKREVPRPSPSQVLETHFGH